MKRARLSLEDNDSDHCDLTFSARTARIQERGRPCGRRAARHGRTRFDQSASGAAGSAARRRDQVTDDVCHGTKDRSWGVAASASR